MATWSIRPAIWSWLCPPRRDTDGQWYVGKSEVMSPCYPGAWPSRRPTTRDGVAAGSACGRGDTIRYPRAVINSPAPSPTSTPAEQPGSQAVCFSLPHKRRASMGQALGAWDPGVCRRTSFPRSVISRCWCRQSGTDRGMTSINWVSTSRAGGPLPAACFSPIRCMAMHSCPARRTTASGGERGRLQRAGRPRRAEWRDGHP